MAESAQAESRVKGKKGGKGLLIAGVVAVVLVVNLLVLGRVVLSGKGAAPKPKEEEIGAKVNLEEFLVNLAGGQDHYLRTTIALGLKKDLTEEKVKEDTAPIRDAIVSVLSSKRLEELSSETGKEKLKQELKDRINHELDADKVVKIYFTAFATQ